jgi:hypothetical protein
LLSKVKRAAAEQVKMLGGMVSGIGTAPAKKVLKKK